jgi:hypothetical protein
MCEETVDHPLVRRALSHTEDHPGALARMHTGAAVAHGAHGSSVFIPGQLQQRVESAELRDSVTSRVPARLTT